MNSFQWLLGLHEVCQFQTKEGLKFGKASNSELRRWINNGVVHINNKRMAIEDEIPDSIESIVLFPNNKKAITTLW